MIETRICPICEKVVEIEVEPDILLGSLVRCRECIEADRDPEPSMRD